jgi:hypothetical protein
VLSSNLLNVAGKEGKEGVWARHLPIYNGKSSMLLKAFVDLFNSVTAECSAINSFAETVALMGKQPCPIPSSI